MVANDLLTSLRPSLALPAPGTEQGRTPASPLTADDAAHDSDPLLHTILANNLDLSATHAQTNLPLPTLLRFINRPDIQDLINAYLRTRLAAANARLLSETLDSRLKSIRRLEALSDTTTDPIEQRRHQSLILRFSTPITFPNYHRIHSQRSARLTPIPELSNLKSEILPSASPHPTPNITPAPKSEIPNPKSEISSPPSSPHPTSDIPHPTSTRPLPLFAAPSDLIAHFERHLKKQDSRTEQGRAAALLSLHRYFTPNATINNTPVPSDPAEFARTIDPTSKSHLITDLDRTQRRTLSPGEFSHTELMYLVRRRQYAIRAELTLSRPSVAHPWRIEKIITTQNTC